MSILTRSRPTRTVGEAAGVPDDATVTAAPPRLPGRRNPRWIALGVLAICLGGLLSYVLYARVAAPVAVVAVATTIHRGDVVDAADLTTVTISGSAQLATVPARELDGLVGRRAVYDLVAGSLVPAGAIADVAVPQPGRSVVGLKLDQGRAPDGLLTTGSPVRLVTLAAATDAGGGTDDPAGRVYFAKVVSQAPAADGTSTLVNVDVSVKDAPVVARLSAESRLALLRDAEG